MEYGSIIQVDKRLKLIIFDPGAHLNNKMVSLLFKFLKEKPKYSRWNRFIMLHDLVSSTLLFEDIAVIGHKRRKLPMFQRHVKTVIYADNQLALGLAQMYQQAAEEPGITIEVHSSRRVCEDELGIPQGSLEPYISEKKEPVI